MLNNGKEKNSVLSILILTTSVYTTIRTCSIHLLNFFLNVRMNNGTKKRNKIWQWHFGWRRKNILWGSSMFFLLKKNILFKVFLTLISDEWIVRNVFLKKIGDSDWGDLVDSNGNESFLLLIYNFYTLILIQKVPNLVSPALFLRKVVTIT